MDSKYKCVHCGSPADSIYRRYGPSVLKLSKCEKCGCFVDKYVEYDLVIVMIDLVLVSKEAQRHIIYNTPFKAYWKLLVVMIMIETYGVWSKGNIINIFLNNYCSPATPKVIPIGHGALNGLMEESCDVWLKEINSADPFISEMTFYVASAAVLSAILMIVGVTFFVIILFMAVKIYEKLSKGKLKLPLRLLLKGISIGYTSIMFTLPMVIWGASDDRSRSAGFYLATAYSYYTFYSIMQVLIEKSRFIISSVVFLAFVAKYFSICITKTAIENNFK